MKIDVLTVSGCPHRPLAVTRLLDAIERSGVEASVVERVIDDPEVAATLGMAGSPTILVDGRDPFGSGAAAPSVSCRLYRSETGVEGAPSLNALIEALTTAPATP